jgi:hypothetical protein
MAGLLVYPIEGLVNEKGEGVYCEPAQAGRSARTWIATVQSFNFGMATKNALAFTMLGGAVRVADDYAIIDNPDIAAEVGPDGNDIPEPEPETDPMDEPSDVACAREGCDAFLTKRQAARKGAKYCSPECRTLAGKQREADRKQANKKS